MAAGTHGIYNVPQPVQPVDGNPVWTRAEIQRAPDNGSGAPGAWATIASALVLSTSGRWAYQYDDSDELNGDEWYRHRYTDTANTNQSDYSTPIQVNEDQIILWSLLEIPDAAVTTDDVVSWRSQAITDLWPDIWRRDRVTIAATTATASDGTTYTNHRYELADEIDVVGRVEKVDTVTGGHITWLCSGVDYEQEDRTIRIFKPTTTYDYVVHGKHRYRDISEIGEDLFQLIFWMVRKSYLDRRVQKRANSARFLALDRTDDTTPEQIDMFLQRAQFEVDSRRARLITPEYPIDIAAADW